MWEESCFLCFSFHDRLLIVSSKIFVYSALNSSLDYFYKVLNPFYRRESKHFLAVLLSSCVISECPSGQGCHFLCWVHTRTYIQHYKYDCDTCEKEEMKNYLRGNDKKLRVCTAKKKRKTIEEYIFVLGNLYDTWLGGRGKGIVCINRARLLY